MAFKTTMLDLQKKLLVEMQDILEMTREEALERVHSDMRYRRRRKELKGRK